MVQWPFSYIPIETNFIEQPLQVITMLMFIHYKYVYRRTLLHFRFPMTESVKVESKKHSNKSMDQIQKMYLLHPAK